MKVSKDQHLKAEGNCLSAAAAEWSVTRDQTPGTIWGYHTSTFFLKIFANMYRERKTWSSRKFGESKFFLAKMAFSRWKNLEQPSCRMYKRVQVNSMTGSSMLQYTFFLNRGSLLQAWDLWSLSFPPFPYLYIHDTCIFEAWHESFIFFLTVCWSMASHLGDHPGCFM